MSTTERFLGQTFEISINADRPKLPPFIIDNLKLSPGDVLVVKEISGKIFLRVADQAIKSKFEISRFKVGSDGRSTIPQEVLRAIGIRRRDRLKLTRVPDRGFQLELIESPRTLIDEIFEEADRELKKEARQARQIKRNYKRGVECLSDAFVLLEEVGRLAEKLPKSRLTRLYQQHVEQALEHISDAGSLAFDQLDKP